MATPIRPEDLPAVPGGTVAPTSAFILDNGTGVFKATPQEIVEATDAILPATLAASGASDGIGFLQSGTGAVPRTVQDKLRDAISVKDFGALGNVQNLAALTAEGGGPAHVDTAAFQAAIDYAYGGGTKQPLAIIVPPGVYAVGALTTYPNTTLIGSGRMTSALACIDGVTGKWVSDRGNGAQKQIISGLTFYGRGNTNLTHVFEAGNDGTQFGTQGIYYDLWFRDAPNGYAYDVDANVGFFRNIIGENCRHNGRILGNSNSCLDMYSMQAGQNTTGAISGGPASIIGLELYGCHVVGLEVEATATGALPLKINGDTSVFSPVISSAASTTFSHLIEVDTTNYDDWSLLHVSLQPRPAGYTVTNGMVKVGSSYYGGTTATTFTGRSFVKALTVSGAHLAVKYQRWNAFAIRIQNTAGTLQHRIGALNSSSAVVGCAPSIRSPNNNLQNTPVSSAAFSNGVSITTSGQLVFDTFDPQVVSDCMMQATLVINSAAADYHVACQCASITIDGVAANRFYLQLFPLTGSTSPVAFSTTTIGSGLLMEINVQGFMA